MPQTSTDFRPIYLFICYYYCYYYYTGIQPLPLPLLLFQLINHNRLLAFDYENNRKL